ncbi:phosphorylase [Leptospira sp. 201903071]|uniref:5'-methylthioadenosine/S-adenosylhomocysteine nucleosidase family protein n=1 Tax=Leptospira ainazelensis TaxID=2810034 RepID=UPI0019659837|nr:phosphorylase [Leptospira ainazelensis]MBM9499832.1 phosphorylase [Leptospira ainazelensis]
MIFISTALFPEAKPLIESLGLKSLKGKSAFPVYQNENYTLVVSGIGKISSAIATSFLLSGFEDAIQESSWILNFGICGSSKEYAAIGESFLIHKVADWGSGKNVYPDLLFKSPLKEASLVTVDKPVFENESSEHKNTLVDMEAFGFFQASKKFFTSDKIRIVKTVSDHFTKLESSSESNFSNVISDRIQSALPDIHAILRIPIVAERRILLDEEELKTLDSLIEFLRLSETETIQLKDWMLGYKIRTGNSSEDGLKFLNQNFGSEVNKVKTREEGKKGLYELRQFYQS